MTTRRRDGGPATDRWRGAVVAVLLAAVLLGACASGGGSDSADDGGDGVPSEDRPFSGGDEAAAERVPDAPTEVALGAAESAPGRSVVSTAALTVEVASANEGAARAVTATEAVGGRVHAEASSFRDGVQSVLTLKVPPEEFRPLLDTLGDLGDPIVQEVSTEDVTERVVDLESRIRTAEASIARLRGFVEGAGDVDSLARLEGELLVRETDRETLVGQLRTLEDRVAEATIVLTLVEDAPAVAAPGFTSGLREGWEAFVAAGTVALTLLGALLPWLPFVFLGVVGWRLAGRSARRAAPAE